MANVKYTRGNTAFIAGTTIQDGQMLFNTTTGQQYLDIDASTRKEIGKVADTTLSTTSTNAVANSAITGSIVNTMADVNAITNNYIPCGTNAVKELSNSFGWIDVTSQCTWSPLLHTEFIHYAKVNPKIRILDVTFLLKAGRESGASIITLPAQYSPNIDKNMTIGQVVYYHIGNVGISYVIDGSHVIKGFHTTNAVTQDYEYFHFMLPY